MITLTTSPVERPWFRAKPSRSSASSVRVLSGMRPDTSTTPTSGGTPSAGNEISVAPAGSGMPSTGMRPCSTRRGYTRATPSIAASSVTTARGARSQSANTFAKRSRS